MSERGSELLARLTRERDAAVAEVHHLRAENSDLRILAESWKRRVNSAQKVWLGFYVEEGELRVEPATNEEQYDFLIRDDPQYHKSGCYYAVPVDDEDQRQEAK